jgi:hypothetical protein
MKKDWDNLMLSLEAFQADVEEVVNALKPGVKTDKIRAAMAKSWDALCKKVSNMDQHISPIDPVQIKMPWKSKEFLEAWSFYKQYLEEEHHITMKSREFAAGEESDAIKMLEFLESSGYRSFFRPTIKQASGDEPAPANETTTTFIPSNEPSI